MRATLLLAESLKRQALRGPVSVTIRGKDGADTFQLSQLQSGEIATLVTMAVHAMQQKFAAGMGRARRALSAGLTIGDPEVVDLAAAYPDLLSWLAESETMAEVFGQWVEELDPWLRLLACRALANSETKALDDIDRRWRGLGGQDDD